MVKSPYADWGEQAIKLENEAFRTECVFLISTNINVPCEDPHLIWLIGYFIANSTRVSTGVVYFLAIWRMLTENK